MCLAVHVLDCIRSKFPKLLDESSFKKVNPQLRKSLLLNFSQENLVSVLSQLAYIKKELQEP